MALRLAINPNGKEEALELVRGRDQYNRYVTVYLYRGEPNNEDLLDALPATEENVLKVRYAAEVLALVGKSRVAFATSYDRPRDWS